MAWLAWLKNPERAPEDYRGRGESRRGLIGLSAIVALLGAYSIWGVQSGRSTLSPQRAAIGDLTGELEALTSENATLKTQLSDTRSELDAARKSLAETADRARAPALQNRSEARRSAQQLEGATSR